VGTLLFLAVVAILAAVGALTILEPAAGAVLIPLFIAFAGAPFEELLFRGVLFRILEQGLGSWLALLISAVVFGGLHLINENATLVGAIAIILQAGLMLAAVFMAARQLWLPIGIHFAANFIQSGIFGIAVSGNPAQEGRLNSSLSGPDLLTGGSFGVEGSIVTIVLGATLSLYFLRLAQKRGTIMTPPWRRDAAPPA
jgi:membrane protease YdiL (CAAX protease family)